jgi:hypothetical protein
VSPQPLPSRRYANLRIPSRPCCHACSVPLQRALDLRDFVHRRVRCSTRRCRQLVLDAPLGLSYRTRCLVLPSPPPEGRSSDASRASLVAQDPEGPFAVAQDPEGPFAGGSRPRRTLCRWLQTPKDPLPVAPDPEGPFAGGSRPRRTLCRGSRPRRTLCRWLQTPKDPLPLAPDPEGPFAARQDLQLPKKKLDLSHQAGPVPKDWASSGLARFHVPEGAQSRVSGTNPRSSQTRGSHNQLSSTVATSPRGDARRQAVIAGIPDATCLLRVRGSKQINRSRLAHRARSRTSAFFRLEPKPLATSRGEPSRSQVRTHANPLPK